MPITKTINFKSTGSDGYTLIDVSYIKCCIIHQQDPKFLPDTEVISHLQYEHGVNVQRHISKPGLGQFQTAVEFCSSIGSDPISQSLDQICGPMSYEALSHRLQQHHHAIVYLFTWLHVGRLFTSKRQIVAHFQIIIHFMHSFTILQSNVNIVNLDILSHSFVN